MRERGVFIHVGLPKTGSTFLQRVCFPAFTGIDCYRGTDTIKKYIWNAGSDKLLLSHEAFSGAPIKTVSEGPKGWLVSRSHRLKNLSDLWPDANIIVVVRRHGEWLSSMYRQYLHQGGISLYKDFFDTESDQLVERGGLIYKDMVVALQSYFSGKILFLNYEGLRKDPNETLYCLAEFIGCGLTGPITSQEVNPSVKRLQARILRRLNYFHESRYDEPTKPIFKRSSGFLMYYGLLPIQRLRRRPFKFLSSLGRDVVEQDQIDKANAYYRQDWEWVQKHIGPVGKVL
jgi:hypothetical protein